MTKKQVGVTVDVEAWLIAKQTLPNVSEYVNDCLLSLNNRSNQQYDIKAIKDQLEAISNSRQELSIKEAILKMELKTKEEAEIIKNEEAVKMERFKRWECPIKTCRHLNLMENDRCAKCGLPTRRDPKTQEIFINE